MYVCMYVYMYVCIMCVGVCVLISPSLPPSLHRGAQSDGPSSPARLAEATSERIWH